MILGANARAVGNHLAGWRHPDAWPNPVMNLQYHLDVARIAERGKMHFLFLADGSGVRAMDKPVLFESPGPTDRPAVHEPITLLSAMAMATDKIGLVGTATTTFEDPFTLARKFASLDHLSGGRAAWNVVTTSNAEDALNFSHDEHMPREKRYQRAAEFVEVVNGLWDSWADDAFLQDKATGRFLDASKVHVLNHKGEFFSVRGPLNMARPPQGHPIIFSAGQSEPGKDLIARFADCMFEVGGAMEARQATYADVKGRMAKYGRSPDELKIVTNVSVYVGRTAEEAEAQFQELQELISPALGVEYLSKWLEMDLSSYPLDGPVPEVQGQSVGGTSAKFMIADMVRGLTIRQAYQRAFIGSAGNAIRGDVQHVADQMEDAYRRKACDGFVISGAVMGGDLERFVDLVIPELQRRGVFRKEYAGKTFRENLGLPRPANPFFA